jgi:hypothetical protein
VANNKASVKWASDDDAGDLLAGILDDTATEAALEQQRIEADLKAREEEERRRKAAEEERKRLEAEARISAEMDRLEQIEKRRTQKVEALKIEELKASGQWKPPEEPVERKQPDAAAIQAAIAAQAAMAAPVPQAAAQPMAQAMPMAPEPQSKKPVAILGGVVALVVVAAVAVVALAGGGYELDNTPYTKAVYSPKDSQTLLVEMAFAPLPKPEPVVEAPAAAPAARRPAAQPARRPDSASASSAPSKQAAPKGESKKKLDLNLDFDPFGGGF